MGAILYPDLQEKELDYMMYKMMVEKLGYHIELDLSRVVWGDDNDATDIRLLCTSNDKKIANRKWYHFYEVFSGAALSLSGFKDDVVNKADVAGFTKGVANRMIGSRISKEELIIALIRNDEHLIDDIYRNGDVIIPKRDLGELFRWVNFKGANRAKLRSQAKE